MNNNNVGNILLVSNYSSDTAYAWWLMEHFWVTLANLFAEKGGEVYLAYPSIITIPEHIANAPIVPVELDISSRDNILSSKARKFIKDHKITSIYLTDHPYVNLKYPLMRLYGIRHVIIHDHTPGDRPPITGLKGWIKSCTMRIRYITADRVFCVSDLMKNRSISNARMPADRCIVIQNGIPQIACHKARPNPIRETLGISLESFVVCTTGRAHPYKRFDFIIRCAEMLHSRAPELDIVFLLVGDGPALPELKLLVNRLQLYNIVRLLGFRNDVREILCASNMAFHAARGEGFSLSILEYMSAGLPVIVPDIPSVRQAIVHNVTGLVYPENDIGTAVDYIQSLAMNRNRCNTFGQSAKAQADTKYNLERCTEDLVNAAVSSFSL